MGAAAPSARAVCSACPRRCRIEPGGHGACRARRNEAGAVVAENYARITSLALDPVEKKPLARFLPGRFVLSVGSYGCNLRCPFCQNHEIAQAHAGDIPWRRIAPDELVRTAADLRAHDPDVAGIAFTYNEPLVGWEYVRDCAQLAHEAGLAAVLVSNGLANESVIRELAPHIDAANIDLKAFSPAFYAMCLTGNPSSPQGEGAAQEALGARALACVKRTIELLAACPGCHLEVTTLVVPGLNDDAAEIDAAARWLSSIPYREDPPARWAKLAAPGAEGTRGDAEPTYHVTRFFPRWRLSDRGPTPVSTVYELAEVARRHLSYVHVGNC